MISSKKILEGCLLAMARDVSEKWNLYLNGVDYVEDEEELFPKALVNKTDYNQHIIPLYKLAGYLCVNLRAGMSSSSTTTKRREISTLMDNFLGDPQNLSPFSTLVTGEEEWWKSVYKQVQHTSLVIRDKRYVRILSSELVVGDIVFVTAGDIVGADVRVLVCTPGSVVDLFPISHTSHDYKYLQEKPNDTDPLYDFYSFIIPRRSCNVIPACCSLIEGYVFGIVIKTGSSTIYATTEPKRKENEEFQSSVFSFFFIHNRRLLSSFHSL